MADDLNRTAPEDTKKINLAQQWEIDYWTNALGVSEKKLQQAVAAVGVLVVDVKAWLRSN
jgi:hypothetical protein